MLSIIVPVYNAENYLQECINSLINQTYEDFEIILVDNNSTDGSARICQYYCNIDCRIKYFKVDKRGAATARNLGIDKAKGEFITFVDSDDYVEKDAYSLFINRMLYEDSDICISSYRCVNEKGQELGWYKPRLKKYAEKSPLDGKEACRVFLTSRDIEGFSWNKVFRTELIKSSKIKYDENKTAYEDMSFVFDALAHSKKVSFINLELYNYRQRSQSLTRVQYEKKTAEYEDALKQIYSSALRLGLEKEAESSLIYRKILSDYLLGISHFSGLKFITREITSILKYQTTEKYKTILKLVFLNFYR